MLTIHGRTILALGGTVVAVIGPAVPPAAAQQMAMPGMITPARKQPTQTSPAAWPPKAAEKKPTNQAPPTSAVKPSAPTGMATMPGMAMNGGQGDASPMSGMPGMGMGMAMQGMLG